MKMRGIKLLSTLLVLALVVSLGVGALASGDPAGSGEIRPPATGEPQNPVDPVPDNPPEEEVAVAFYAGEYGFFRGVSGMELITYQARGSRIELITPTAISDAYIFDGWYTGIQGRGDRVTENTIVDGEEVKVYANWLPNPEVIPVIELDTVYPLEVSGGGVLFAFTPDKTDLYDIYTQDNDPTVSIASIRLLDSRLYDLAAGSPLDYDFNVIVHTELTAGTTYYIEFSAVFGMDAEFSGIISRSETVPVTFHADPDTAGDAYFDGDPSILEKTVEVRKGAHLENYALSGLEIADDALIDLVGWSLVPGGEDNDEAIYATGPMDVYAIYHHYSSVILDTNGGAYPSWITEETQYTYRYTPGDPFTPPYDPQIDDSSLSFAGWATTPDAAEPDVIQYLEYEDLGDVLYAVYTEPVTVTFDANGGYMFIDPNAKTFETVYGKGHIFYAAHAENEDPYMELIGWIDQNGVVIPQSSTDYPYYQFTEDTYLTAIWGRNIVVDANGACFRFDASLTALKLLFPTLTPFDSDYIVGLVGEPINFDDMKYLAGWATTPDAEEPDVIDGETDVTDLTWIYAIWKDDSYYFAGGENQTWAKGSPEGLTVTVKRTGDDTMTFPCFQGVKVDGEQVTSFKRTEGSLILTLEPEYLNALDTGDHTLRIEFTGDAAVETGFKVTESGASPEPVPSGEATDEPSDEPSDEPTDEPSDEPEGSDEPSENKDQKSNSNNSNNNKKNSSSNNNKSSSPKTGDGTNIALWSVLLGLSLLGTAGAAWRLAARKREE